MPIITHNTKNGIITTIAIPNAIANANSYMLISLKYFIISPFLPSSTGLGIFLPHPLLAAYQSNMSYIARNHLNMFDRLLQFSQFFHRRFHRAF